MLKFGIYTIIDFYSGDIALIFRHAFFHRRNFPQNCVVLRLLPLA